MSEQIGAARMRELAKIIQQQIPGLGFCLITFEFEKKGLSNYISNAMREDMITALKETVAKFQQGRDHKTPEEN